MITETCVCGATFRTDQKDWAKESDDQLEFLNAHRVCRESDAFYRGGQKAASELACTAVSV